MKEKQINSWRDFQIAVTETMNYESHNLFRGQAFDEPPESSLYRSYGDMAYSDYIECIDSILFRLNAFSNVEHKSYKHIPQEPFPLLLFGQGNKTNLYENLKTLIYLRHHGFPSPLLDWTKSAYIAAYFAFCNHLSSKKKSITENVVTFHQYEELLPTRSEWVDDMNIYTIGNNLPVLTKRHFIQQTEYSYAAYKEKEPNTVFFGSHDEAIKKNNELNISKWKISTSLCAEFMSHLGNMNINAYTLFSSEDSFVRSLHEELFIHTLSTYNGPTIFTGKDLPQYTNPQHSKKLKN